MTASAAGARAFFAVDAIDEPQLFQSLTDTEAKPMMIQETTAAVYQRISPLDRVIEALPKYRNSEIQFQFGLDRNTVETLRKRFNISPREEILDRIIEHHGDELGNISDESLARKHDLPLIQVKRARRALNRKPFAPPTPHDIAKATRASGRPRSIPWDPQWDSLLGTMPDLTLSKSIGIPAYRIKQRRDELDIPLFEKTKWNPEHDPLLGTESDFDIAKQLLVPVAWVRNRRSELNIPKKGRAKQDVDRVDQSLLGCMPDAELAAKYGIAESVIRSLRYERRIARYRPGQSDRQYYFPMKDWKPAWDKRLKNSNEKLLSEELTKEHGSSVPVQAIRTRKKHLRKKDPDKLS
jgi:hypothetical protein